jgi:hypothetical protein
MRRRRRADYLSRDDRAVMQDLSPIDIAISEFLTIKGVDEDDADVSFDGWPVEGYESEVAYVGIMADGRDQLFVVSIDEQAAIAAAERFAEDVVTEDNLMLSPEYLSQFDSIKEATDAWVEEDGFWAVWGWSSDFEGEDLRSGGFAWRVA